MIKPIPTFGSTRIKKGFAFFPVVARDCLVWLQLYEVVQTYDLLNKRWYNDYFTCQTFEDWTKI